MKKNTKLHLPISSQEKESLKIKASSFGITLTAYCLLILKKAVVSVSEVKISKK
jgi:predicted DNA binding CopG/RHH family protein